MEEGLALLCWQWVAHGGRGVGEEGAQVILQGERPLSAEHTPLEWGWVRWGRSPEVGDIPLAWGQVGWGHSHAVGWGHPSGMEGGWMGTYFWHGDRLDGDLLLSWGGDVPPGWMGTSLQHKERWEHGHLPWLRMGTSLLRTEGNISPAWDGDSWGHLLGAEGSEVPCPTCPLLTAACCSEQVNTTMVRNLLSSATVRSEEGIPGVGWGDSKEHQGPVLVPPPPLGTPHGTQGCGDAVPEEVLPKKPLVKMSTTQACSSASPLTATSSP